jgi:hypothetical protein
VQGREHVERLGIAAGVAARGEPLCLLLALAAGEIGDELKKHVGRRRQRDAVGERLAQRAFGDRKIRRRLQRDEHRFDQIEVVAGENAE